jgi:tRNA(fMet)-specific endonuclease VapC
MIYLADTNFLIRCWRDAKHPERLRNLSVYFNSAIRLVWVVKAEFLRGAEIAQHDHEHVSEFLSRHKTLWPDDNTLAIYSQIYVQLHRVNQMIGPHDLWIAATALQHRLPLLTRNVREFRRVPGLNVVDYSVPTS